jgi:hypothetical protein
MIKAIIEGLKAEAKPAKLIVFFLMVILTLWVLVIMKKNNIAKQINPLEAA